MKPLAIGLDLGTSGLKAVLLAADGQVLGEAVAPLGVQRPQPGHNEQHPADWLAAADEAVATLRQGVGPADWAAVAAPGILGSIDANRGDEQLGWDTDQFPNNHVQMVPAMLEIIRHGGLGQGGMNFDAKVRRQSFDPIDQLVGHIGGIDTLARAFLCAAALHESAELERTLAARYAGWDGELGRAIHAGASLDDLAAQVHAQGLAQVPQSGRQERLENIVNRFV